MDELRQELRRYKQVFTVCDRAVEAFARRLCGKSGRLFAIDADEAHKNMDTVLDICRWLLSCGAGRDALLLSVGGGVTTDIAGFAACIYKRGIRYANVPTTLLSQVDAGIGGKTGANLDGFKNLLGVIRQPEFTAIFPEVLQTLPERELRSGLAEMLKSFIIKNPSHAYERTVALFSAPRDNDFHASLGELIRLAAGIKQEIVEKDEFERGPRRKLNLGHTWGHAIEWHCPGTFTHGEAVAIGMVQAAMFAEKTGLAEEPGLAERIAADLSSCGLPTTLPCTPAELLPAILKDKKAEGAQIRLVLPVKIGKVVVRKFPAAVFQDL